MSLSGPAAPPAKLSLRDDEELPVVRLQAVESSEPAVKVIPGPIEVPAPPVPARIDAWQDEVSKRVEGFRKRRARQGGKDDLSGTFDFDFNAPEAPREAEGLPAIEFPANAPALPPLDLETTDERHNSELRRPRVDEVSLWYEQPASTQGGLPPSRSIEPTPPAIVVESPPQQETIGHIAGLDDSTEAVAKTGPRFIAGLLDLLVLLAGAAVFGLIFWRAGGRLSRHPLDFTVVAFIACLFTLIYFSVMTAMMSSTPGLMWMGLEIRAANGQEPTVRDAAWRAIGCLISAGALMLGFIWAVIDSDGLTWHDRISGTFVAPSRRWQAMVEQVEPQS